jgi:hypothetical protein
MEQDLHITDNQYLLALTVFFFSYAVFEVCFEVVTRSTVTKRLIGAIQCLLKTTKTLDLVERPDAHVGNNDGMYRRRMPVCLPC